MSQNACLLFYDAGDLIIRYDSTTLAAPTFFSCDHCERKPSHSEAKHSVARLPINQKHFGKQTEGHELRVAGKAEAKKNRIQTENWLQRWAKN